MKRRPQVLHLDALPQGVLLFTKAQMAAAMQVSLRCLTGMMNRGEISYLKINGRIVRFRPEDFPPGAPQPPKWEMTLQLPAHRIAAIRFE